MDKDDIRQLIRAILIAAIMPNVAPQDFVNETLETAASIVDNFMAKDEESNNGDN